MKIRYIIRFLLIGGLILLALASTVRSQDKQEPPKLERPAHTVGSVRYIERITEMTRSSPQSEYKPTQQFGDNTTQYFAWDFEPEGKMGVVNVVFSWKSEDPDEVTVHGLSPFNGGITHRYKPTDFILEIRTRFWYFRIAPEYQKEAKAQMQNLFSKHAGHVPNFKFE